MGPTRLWAQLQQTQAGMDGLALEVQQSLAGPRRVRRDHAHPPSVLVLEQPVLERAGGTGPFALNDRPINLFDAALAKLLGQPGRRLAGPGKQQHSRHGPVQSMDHTQEYVAGLLIFLFEVTLYRTVQRHLKEKY